MKALSAGQFERSLLPKVVARGTQDLSKFGPRVRRILSAVRKGGDKALIQYTRSFDGVKLSRGQLKVSRDEIAKAKKALTRQQIKALRLCRDNIERYHRAQAPRDWEIRGKGFTVGQMSKPLKKIGIYVPGGRAAYPSTLLMCAVPAKVVGVEEIYVCTPPSNNGRVNPSILAVADIIGITCVFKVGGAQAIGAMAFGTETIPKVDKIVGPGNAFVTTAKLEVSREVAIDLPAGPSEVVIVADSDADPQVIASDLIAQAEHDPEAWAILFCPSRRVIRETQRELKKQVKSLAKRRSVSTRNIVAVTSSLEKAMRYVNHIAPEHVQLFLRDSRYARSVNNAGAIFIGEYTPVALGDYSAGTNHVLPTGGYARVYSGLSTFDFVKRISFVRSTRQGLRTLGEATIAMAEMEGLHGHAESVRRRGG